MNFSLNQIIDWLIHYKYVLVLPFSVVEGPILTVICGFLMKLGYFTFFPLWLILILGDLIGDAFWYAIGRFGAHKLLKRYGYIISLDEVLLEKIESKFREHQNKALIISKLTSGFGFAIVTLTAAGVVRVNFKKFILINLLGGFLWTGLLIFLGYLFGQLYAQIDKALRLGFLAAAIIIVVAALYGFQKYARSLVVKNKI